MVYNEEFGKYIFDYENFNFSLFIPSYWIKIYKGKEREPLYQDYRLMLDKLKNVDKSKYVLDIGANHGLFSVPACMLGYKVFGFEPVAKNMESLSLAVAANGLKNFDMFGLALSNKNEEVAIYVPECPDNASLSQAAAVSNMKRKEFRIEKVNCVRFDDWIESHDVYKNVGFIKIDVQGGEFDVLSGMSNFLTNTHDIYLICEFENLSLLMGHTYEELENLILSLGFIRQPNITGGDRLYFKS